MSIAATGGNIAPSVNMTIQQGVDFSKTFTSKEADGSSTNLFGYTGISKMKKFPDGDVSFAATFTVGISSVGIVTISLTDTQTQTLNPGRYYYDVVLTNSGGIKSRFVQGQVFVDAGISTGA